MRSFDLCVIGSGPGGQKAAIQAAKLGRRACVVEAREIGGVAVHTGTIPSKTLREMIQRLVGAAALSPEIRDEIAVRRGDAMRRLSTSYEDILRAETTVVRDHLAANGISVVPGVARFVDASTIEVESADGTEAIRADRFCIAVGTEPSRPGSIPFDGRDVITSDDLLRLEQLPHSMIVIGGGVIGTEYASMFAQLGIRVTLVEGRPRLLDFADTEIVEALQFHLRREGVTMRLGEKVASVRVIPAPPGSRSIDDRVAEAVLESGKRLHADCILYCAGRQGATAALGLGHIGVSPDARGRIPVDGTFRTAAPNVYAVGDVIGFPALASTSMDQGRVAACHMFGEPVETGAAPLPYGIYSIPEISMVGATEQSLTEQGTPYESGVARYAEVARGKILGDDIGMLKLLFHEESRVLLGVHAIGTGATELVHVGQAVIAFGGRIEYFVETVFNYPTLAECYRIAALNGLNRLRDS